MRYEISTVYPYRVLANAPSFDAAFDTASDITHGTAEEPRHRTAYVWWQDYHGYPRLLGVVRNGIPEHFEQSAI